MKRFFITFVVWLTLFAFFSNPGFSDHKTTHKPMRRCETIVVGHYLSDSYYVLSNKLKPFLKQLDNHLSTPGGKCYRTKLKILRTYKMGQLAVLNDNVDIIRMGVASFIKVQFFDPDVRVIAEELRKGSHKMHGAIIVSSEYNNVYDLSDLEGLDFAFGNVESTTGNYISKYTLRKHGITQSKLGDTANFRLHKDVYNSVVIGDYAGGALKMTAVLRYNDEGLVRVLMKFYTPNKVWLASNAVSPELFEKLQDTFLEFNDPSHGTMHKACFKGLKIRGFTRHVPRRYEDAIKAVETIKLFDEY